MQLGDREYIVPALSIAAFRRLGTKIQSVSANPDDPASVAAVLEVCLIALQRNYPSMTYEELEERVDLSTLPDLMSAALGLNRPAPKP